MLAQCHRYNARATASGIILDVAVRSFAAARGNPRGRSCRQGGPVSGLAGEKALDDDDSLVLGLVFGLDMDRDDRSRYGLSQRILDFVADVMGLADAHLG